MDYGMILDIPAWVRSQGAKASNINHIKKQLMVQKLTMIIL